MKNRAKKNPDLTIRLTPEERQAIERAAEADHLSTSTWIRRLALFGAEDRSPPQAERARVAGLAARVRSGETPQGTPSGRKGQRRR